MTYITHYAVRPSKSARTDLKDAFRVFLSGAALNREKLDIGEICILRSTEGASGTAIAWLGKDIGDTVVQTSKTLQAAYGFTLKDKVTISKAEPTTRIVDAENIQLSDLKQEVDCKGQSSNPTNDDVHWAWYLKWILDKAEHVCQGMVFENVELRGLKRSFVVDRVSASSGHGDAKRHLFRYQSSSRVELNISSAAEPLERLEVTDDGVGGLGRQIQQLNKRLSAFNEELHNLKMPSWYERRRRKGGVLLHGPEGTGKSLLLKKLTAASWRKVCTIDKSVIGRYVGDTENSVRKVFAEALANQPSLIIIDDLETIAGKTQSESLSTNIAPIIGSELDRLEDSRVLVVAATRRPSEIDESLRKRGRLRNEIDIPVPDANARIEILKVLQDLPRTATDELSRILGERTHGYVGADLDELLDIAAEKARDRSLAAISKQSNLHTKPNEPPTNDPDTDKTLLINLTLQDFEHALTTVRPTAMREVFLEAPKVHWDDIGGQEEVKQSLRQVIEYPFKSPSRMVRLGLSQRKGLLLYGPPGCSKTLTAQALATEGGLNFLAVKGAELLNMYVGESERAIREVFRKARAASPSIIFFDEIDAIGTSTNQNNGINVLTTLLNEIDGIESLKGVLVLAATNKPQLLDPALLRPGRLSTSLYVGPPNQTARHEILKIHTRKMDISISEEEKVSIESLAERTEGYSGAEIASICETAGWAAFDESEIGEVEVSICERHFEVALGKVERQISREVREEYENWRVGGGIKRL
ncbi:MAG: hypothetical protein M1812_002501 [Candelaria pacifica]|nr:MAG: hypothetical protein M1812_002501 [Candelaria pacifica]